VVPDKGTKPGDTALSWEYRVDGEKLPPPVKPEEKPKEPEKKPEEKPKEPEQKPEEKPKEPEKKPEEPKPPVKEEPKEPKIDTPVVAKEEEGIEVILIIVCGVLVVLVLVCCVLYIQYRNKLTEQKQVQQDIEAKLHDAQQGIEKLKNEKPAVTLKAPEEVNQSSVGNDRSRMES
jgi:type IV secretory pathway VirB10-like protein